MSHQISQKGEFQRNPGIAMAFKCQPVGIDPFFHNANVLVLLMVHTGMVGMVVCGGDKERDVQSTAAVLNEIGVGGLSVEVGTGNEAALKSLVVQHEAITGETFQRRDPRQKA